jgi:hypothetical protein
MIEAEIVSISEVIDESYLPDGEYEGVWGGRVVKLKHNCHYFELGTSSGIRAMAAPCVVTVKDGKATVRAK